MPLHAAFELPYQKNLKLYLHNNSMLLRLAKHMRDSCAVIRLDFSASPLYCFGPSRHAFRPPRLLVFHLLIISTSFVIYRWHIPFFYGHQEAGKHSSHLTGGSHTLAMNNSICNNDVAYIHCVYSNNVAHVYPRFGHRSKHS